MALRPFVFQTKGFLVQKFHNINQALSVNNMEISPFRMASHDENWRKSPYLILNDV